MKEIVSSRTRVTLIVVRAETCLAARIAGCSQINEKIIKIKHKIAFIFFSLESSILYACKSYSGHLHSILRGSFCLLHTTNLMSSNILFCKQNKRNCSHLCISSNSKSKLFQKEKVSTTLQIYVDVELLR
jgi:hypothetical protein